MNNSRAPHILNAASNLVGFSFVVFTTLRSLHNASSYLDELAAFEIAIFSCSCLLSFLGLRYADDQKRSERYEGFADYLFFIGLIILCIMALLAPFTNLLG